MTPASAILMAIPERYNTGYNIGVGGAVVRDGRLLLVRRASRHGRGNWQLPGGFIEPEMHKQVRRRGAKSITQAIFRWSKFDS
jgi:ADP-ribose pyrophosphatase YjhB (NUDIX family)